MPSCCFGQLGGRRRSCFAYIDSELKMQSLSQRAWRFVFFSPRVYLALQHPSFSIFTSKVILPSNHTDGWILYFPSHFMSILSSSSTRSTSRVISHVWQNDIVGLFSDTPPPDYLPPSTGMFGGKQRHQSPPRWKCFGPEEEMKSRLRSSLCVGSDTR